MSKDKKEIEQQLQPANNKTPLIPFDDLFSLMGDLEDELAEKHFRRFIHEEVAKKSQDFQFRFHRGRAIPIEMKEINEKANLSVEKLLHEVIEKKYGQEGYKLYLKIMAEMEIVEKKYNPVVQRNEFLEGIINIFKNIYPDKEEEIMIFLIDRLDEDKNQRSPAETNKKMTAKK